jgi:hypothetical protein
MNPVAKVIALKAAVAGSAQDHLQIFNLEVRQTLEQSLQQTLAGPTLRQLTAAPV